MARRRWLRRVHQKPRMNPMARYNSRVTPRIPYDTAPLPPLPTLVGIVHVFQPTVAAIARIAARSAPTMPPSIAYHQIKEHLLLDRCRLSADVDQLRAPGL